VGPGLQTAALTKRKNPGGGTPGFSRSGDRRCGGNRIAPAIKQHRAMIVQVDLRSSDRLDQSGIVVPDIADAWAHRPAYHAVGRVWGPGLDDYGAQLGNAAATSVVEVHKRKAVPGYRILQERDRPLPSAGDVCGSDAEERHKAVAAVSVFIGAARPVAVVGKGSSIRASNCTVLAISASGIGLIAPGPGDEASVSRVAAIRIVAYLGQPIGSIRLSDLKGGPQTCGAQQSRNFGRFFRG
jgi:hypothetical protein